MSNCAVLGVVRSQWNAAAIVDELLSTHFASRDLSVLFPDSEILHDPGEVEPGDTVGMLAGVGVLSIPGVGTLLAEGPLLPGLARAQPDAVEGGVTVTLLELGLHAAEAARYVAKLHAGNTLIAVRGHDLVDSHLAEDILIRYGAEEVWASAAHATQPGPSAPLPAPIVPAL